MSKNVISISLDSTSRNYEISTQIFGEKIRIQRVGTDGSFLHAEELVAQFDGKVDAISLGGMNTSYRIADRTYSHKQVQKLALTAKSTPVVDGIHIKNTFLRWAISDVARKNRDIFRYKRIFFISGVRSYGLAEVLSGFTHNISFGDPIFHFNLPFTLHSLKQLKRYAKLTLPLICRSSNLRYHAFELDTRSQNPLSAKHFNQADIIVGDSVSIRCHAPGELKGKVIISDDISAADVEEFRKRGVESLVTVTPPLSERHPFVGLDVIEAIFTCFLKQPTIKRDDDDYLERAVHCDLKPHITVLNKPKDVVRFAHVIHPLSLDHVFKQPKLRFLRYLPHRLVESSIAKIRPRIVSHITGIRSPVTGKNVEGFLISLGATPRELIRRKSGFTYRRLIVASRMAQRLGVKIMSLGAFTKIVGDAGATVAYKSDIAITSGNSLTVSATLEAAKQAVQRMGGRTDRGRVVIIGATGSIGSVCSRLIAPVSKDMVLVAPRPEKLLSLQKTIEKETPGVRLIISTDSAAHLSDADLVITTTSAFGQKVVDVMKLKPGCVVCDVASPPDIKEEDAKRRPDVLVVEAGEIQLPGNPDVGFDIGLPPGIVHACLAESALLAMDGRFENFTIGRNIEMDKVKEIYRLFKKHKLKLAGLRSFGRYVTDEELERKRMLADELRKTYC